MSELRLVLVSLVSHTHKRFGYNKLGYNKLAYSQSLSWFQINTQLAYIEGFFLSIEHMKLFSDVIYEHKCVIKRSAYLLL